MIGFEYGNTRLRIRASRLLGTHDYAALLGSSNLEAMLGALARGTYQPEIESALGRYRGLRRLDEAVRLHLGRQLTEATSFYEGEIRRRLELYEQRWDIRNIRAILRSFATAQAGEAISDLLVPAGALDMASLRELTSQPNARAAIDLLSVWGLPSRHVIRHLRAVLPAARVGEDTLHYDAALDRAYGELVTSAASGPDDAVLQLMQEDLDRRNLIAALRFRTIGDRADAIDRFVPIAGGRVRPEWWLRVAETEDALDVLEVAHRLPPAWTEAIRAWADHGSVAALEFALEDAVAKSAARRLTSGDPLGLDVPLGYFGRVETEAKNLRLVGRMVTQGVAPSEALQSLVGVA